TLYELLQDSVIPTYYNRADSGHSAQWIRMAKRSMASLLPKYDASRMLGEYVTKYYIPAARQGRHYAEHGSDAARQLAAWEQRERACFERVGVGHQPGRRRGVDDQAPALSGQREIDRRLARVQQQEEIVVLDRRAMVVAFRELLAEEQHAERARRRVGPVRL